MKNGQLGNIKLSTDKNNIKNVIANGHLKVVKFLIEKSVDFWEEDNYAIRYAARKGHLEVVKFLIEKVLISRQTITLQLNGQLQMNVRKLLNFRLRKMLII